MMNHVMKGTSKLSINGLGPISNGCQQQQQQQQHQQQQYSSMDMNNHHGMAHYHYHQYPNNYNHQYPMNGHDDGHITILQIDQKKDGYNQNGSYHQMDQPQHQQQSTFEYQSNGLETEFVTVLKIAPSNGQSNGYHHQQQQQHYHHSNMTNGNGSYSMAMTPCHTKVSTTSSSSSSSGKVFVDNRRGEIDEEVIIYRLPGERLGMALRFDGGQCATETIRRVFVQNISANSPASKAIGLMLGVLREGDQIMQIDGHHSDTLTRSECIALLRDAPVCIRLFVRRQLQCNDQCCQLSSMNHVMSNGSTINNNNNNQTGCQMEMNLPEQQQQQQHEYNIIKNGQYLGSMESLKKIPPPVPPRLATTTLSIKRKPKTEMDGTNGVEVTNVSIEQPSPSIEKPPRRKCHMANGNPPPLPPRRPKGPPPKPPVSMVNVIDGNNCSNSSISTTTTTTTTTTKPCSTVPSLVTVITTRVCDVLTTTTTTQCHQQQQQQKSSSTNRTDSVCITTPSSSSTTQSVMGKSSTHIKASATSKVTFTISNSKVSSFIRQTAERLHRKLSGKSNCHDDDDTTKKCISSKQDMITNHNNEKTKTVNDSVMFNCKDDGERPQMKNELQFCSEPIMGTTTTTSAATLGAAAATTTTSTTPTTSTTMPSTAAIYVDTCQDVDNNSVSIQSI